MLPAARLPVTGGRDGRGMLLAYASRHGHALVDRELYLPERWNR